MRALLVSLALAGCTPDVVSGAYLCGPEASCPEGQQCNGEYDMEAGLEQDTCVLASLARPFLCMPEIDLEPDDTMELGYVIEDFDCVSVPFVSHGCMLETDSADWVTFEAPSICAAVEVQARLSFSVAYEALSVELWDVAQNTRLATDGECKAGSDTASIRRCLDFPLVPGSKYGIKVIANGSGNCGGECAYNRYTLTVQLATPG